MKIIEGLKAVWIIQGPVGAIMSYISLTAMIFTLAALVGQAAARLYMLRYYVMCLGRSPEEKRAAAEHKKMKSEGGTV